MQAAEGTPVIEFKLSQNIAGLDAALAGKAAAHASSS
jgi:hypothetical protein